MNITDKRSALEFARAWRAGAGPRRAAWHIAEAAKSQRLCAQLAGHETPTGRDHLAAAAILERNLNR